MSVHAVARAGFSQAAEVYERGRPEYPRAAAEHVRTRFALGADSRVAELGAGTGKFTRTLLAVGLAPVAFEPLAPMRSELRRTLAQAEVVAATAESLPVSERSLDAAVAASAFHWFDAPRVLDRLASALRPGGGIALLWNHRMELTTFQKELGGLLDARRPASVPSHRNRAWQRALDDDARFTPLERATFPHEQVGSPEMLRDRIGSISFVAALPPEERSSMLVAVEALGTRYAAESPDGRLHLGYTTEVYTTTRRHEL